MASTSLQQAFDLALRHHQAGEFPQAEVIYRQILAQQPRHFGALNYLGVMAAQMGQRETAAGLIRQSIAINPNWAEAHYNLGNVLSESRHWEQAISAYRQAVAKKPHPQAWCNLGLALKETGRLREAISAYRQAIAFEPRFPEAYYNLGNPLSDMGQLDEAIASYRQAIEFNPRFCEAYDNLGTALRDNGQLDDAIAAYRLAIALKHQHAEAHSNLGYALRGKGQLHEAIASCREAIALKPDFAEAHSNLAFALLLQGDFSNGLPEYEWRWKVKNFPSPRRDFHQPQWDGSELNERVILVHTEQGFGDTIQFMRYLPMVAQRGGGIIVECPLELKKVLQDNARGWRVIARGDPLPPFEVHAPLLSLPLIFRTRLQTIPAHEPYLQADAEIAREWRHKLADYSSCIKVGLVWAGNPAFKNDKLRSPRQLSLFAILGNVENVQFFSLQKGDAGKQASHPPTCMRLIDWTHDLHNFSDTVGLIANLDLVISSDTAVAHLAGAMGKPVWVLLPFASDWRWLLDREDSPWYPTMRLFRQTRIGDWKDVVSRVADALARYS